MGYEGRQIRDRDSLRVHARWGLIKGVFGRSKGRRPNVIRNKSEHLSCRVGVDHAFFDLNREGILHKEGLKCGLGVVSWYFYFRT